MESTAQPTLTQAWDANRSIQKSAAVRLFAATNSALYVTLMERHLDFGARRTETDLAIRLERDIAELGLTDQPAAWSCSSCGPSTVGCTAYPIRSSRPRTSVI